MRVVALIALMTGLLALSPAAGDAASSLLVNGTFDGAPAGSLTGWSVGGGSLSLVTDNGGGHAARITATGTAQALLYPTAKPVTGLAAGAAYTATGDVASATAGHTVCLVIKET